MEIKKWYKIKKDVVACNDPVWVMIGLLFESLNAKIDEEKLNKLSFTIRYLFEETEPPKLLTKTVGGIQ